MRIETRHKIEVNTDPQRRCYNGVHFSSEWVWLDWHTLEFGIAPERAQRRLEFWQELNDYAVSQRGAGAKKEFRISEDN